MLNSIKSWGKKLSSSRMLCADLEATIYDPRELPRPLRSDHQEISMSEDRHAEVGDDVLECCVNCRCVGEQLSECVVCWETLRGPGEGFGPVLGCPSCNKLICGMCAARLADTCPFCRAPLPFETKSNGLLERIAARFLDLPKRINKLSKRLSEDFHLACPFSNLSSSSCSCKWKQKARRLGSHLLNDHSTQLIEQDTFSTAIQDIAAEKVSSQICSFVLHSADGEYLLCQLNKTNNEQIGLSFTAMPKRPFAVLIRIKSETRTLRGGVVFPSSRIATSKEFNFSWKRISLGVDANELFFDFKIKPT